MKSKKIAKTSTKRLTLKEMHGDAARTLLTVLSPARDLPQHTDKRHAKRCGASQHAPQIVMSNMRQGASKMRADEISIIFLAILDVVICFAIYESAIGGLSHLFAAA